MTLGGVPNASSPSPWPSTTCAAGPAASPGGTGRSDSQRAEPDQRDSGDHLRPTLFVRREHPRRGGDFSELAGGDAVSDGIEPRTRGSSRRVDCKHDLQLLASRGESQGRVQTGRAKPDALRARRADRATTVTTYLAACRLGRRTCEVRAAAYPEADRRSCRSRFLYRTSYRRACR